MFTVQVVHGTELKLEIKGDLLKAICVQTKAFASSKTVQLPLKNKNSYTHVSDVLGKACGGVICTKNGGSCDSVKEAPCGSSLDAYSGYKVFRVTPKDKTELESLIQMKKSAVDFWIRPTKEGKECDLMLSPEQQAIYLPLIRSAAIQMKEIIQDVHELIQNVKVINAGSAGDLSWDAFYNLDDIYAFMEGLERKYPDKAKVITYGESYEKRELKLISISASRSSSSTTSAASKLKKPVVFIECNIHAREWISAALCTFLINDILVGKKECISSFLGEFDFYFIPVANPDGYAYSHTPQDNTQNYRLWRKTKSPNSKSQCIGTDPNRNFDVHWNESGTSPDPCADDYGGAGPNSEVEVDHLQNYLLRPEISSRLRVFLDVHSYAEAILWPWSYGEENVSAEHYQFFWDTGEKAVEAIKERYDTEYSQGPGYQTYDLNSGTAPDWVYDKILQNKMDRVFTATIELRNTYRGFIVLEKDILPHVLEAMDGICVIIEAVGSSGEGEGGSTTFKPAANSSTAAPSITQQPANPPTTTQDPECDE